MSVAAVINSWRLRGVSLGGFAGSAFVFGFSLDRQFPNPQPSAMPRRMSKADK
jgi:hypothetical protein